MIFPIPRWVGGCWGGEVGTGCFQRHRKLLSRSLARREELLPTPEDALSSVMRVVTMADGEWRMACGVKETESEVAHGRIMSSAPLLRIRQRAIGSDAMNLGVVDRLGLPGTIGILIITIAITIAITIILKMQQ